ncbi:MAG: hypothetical protein ACLFSC_08910 [Wenzhouxiangella sp.]
MHSAVHPAQTTERTGFFANATLLMAILVLLSFPLTYYLPVLARSQNFQLLVHVHGLACFAWIALLALHDRRVLGRVHVATWTAMAVVLPLQLSSPWIARSSWWNGIAPALLGSS